MTQIGVIALKMTEMMREEWHSSSETMESKVHLLPVLFPNYNMLKSKWSEGEEVCSV